MFYRCSDGHGLAHDPFKALVIPRPIGWISTLDDKGIANLAPYSFFNAVCDNPPMVMFSSSGYKDSVRNIELNGEFVCNFVDADMLERMNITSKPVPAEVDEFELCQLEKAKCEVVAPPRVAKAKAALECKLVSTQRLNDRNGIETNNYMVIGEVVGVHIMEDMLVDGKVAANKMMALSRLGYMDYAHIEETYSCGRP
ncbi:flavin reductase family protein [Polycladidibacter stylochi]|uniref:flavin reductase family protein n=1 Tax=Polycladidibacter stylochi TaxID=1807766 RepID=UPI000835B36B|nr:flavin reductase family protein [Pseudovibrio stylochi]